MTEENVWLNQHFNKCSEMLFFSIPVLISMDVICVRFIPHNTDSQCNYDYHYLLKLSRRLSNMIREERAINPFTGHLNVVRLRHTIVQNNTTDILLCKMCWRWAVTCTWPSIHYLYTYPVHGHKCAAFGAAVLSLGERWGPPWTDRQTQTKTTIHIYRAFKITH